MLSVFDADSTKRIVARRLSGELPLAVIGGSICISHDIRNAQFDIGAHNQLWFWICVSFLMNCMTASIAIWHTQKTQSNPEHKGFLQAGLLK